VPRRDTTGVLGHEDLATPLEQVPEVFLKCRDPEGERVPGRVLLDEVHRRLDFPGHHGEVVACHQPPPVGFERSEKSATITTRRAVEAL
jgi:hypothetical protein